MSKELVKLLVDQAVENLPHFMRYILLEWVMIVLLFIDGLVAFVSNEIARHFSLKTPCLFCTRIDHILVDRSASFYYNESICEAHKKDVSSLGYCSVHKKLSDIRSICQTCLLSVASENPDCDRYKSIAGMMNKDFDRKVDDERKSLLLRRLKKDEGEMMDEKSGINVWCSCCGEPLKQRPAKKFLKNLSIKSPAPSPRLSWLASRNDELRETPRSRYTELKFMSDVELETPHHEAPNNDNHAGKEDVRATITPFLQDAKEQNEDPNRTPTIMRVNKYFGAQFDPTQESPRWLNRSSKKLNFDKVDSFVEPFDISPINEVDGDLLNRLKKQVHLDHDSLMAVYMELDKERSAAAVAANNAMAMITRIQEEKAAIQMEALQYQRMMEEQAEYDEEALQIMRDLLIKKEDDMKVLQAELQAYRIKYGDLRKVGSDFCEDDDFPDMRSRSSMMSERSDWDSVNGGDHKESEDPYDCPKEEVSSLDFEGERVFLLGLLKDLEKKMNMDMIKNDDEERDERENKATLTREVSIIKERLRVVEADSGFLKHAARTTQIGDEGAKLLKEIAEHLRAIRQRSPSSKTDA